MATPTCILTNKTQDSNILFFKFNKNKYKSLIGYNVFADSSEFVFFFLVKNRFFQVYRV